MRKLKNLFGGAPETVPEPVRAPIVAANPIPPRRAVGISGIERRIQQTDQRNQQVIEQSFEDINVLMGHAKEMVSLSKKITEKLRNKGLAEDETIQFKSYLLSLGLDDPVTKESAGSNSKYFELLSNEVCNVVMEPLKNSGGSMTLPEAYCRINRARGTQLISPDDLLRACKQFDKLNLPVSLHSFQSGVDVIQLRSNKIDDPETIMTTLSVVDSNKCLDKAKFAQIVGIPMVLAMERLLAAEAYGVLCRDDTISGLVFYPNKFNGY